MAFHQVGIIAASAYTTGALAGIGSQIGVLVAIGCCLLVTGTALRRRMRRREENGCTVAQPISIAQPISMQPESWGTAANTMGAAASAMMNATGSTGRHANVI